MELIDKEFKVNADEIPKQIIVNLSLIEREKLAEMLTNMMIPSEIANNNIQNILHKGLKQVFEKNTLEKTQRELELEIKVIEREEIITQNKFEAIVLKRILENSIFVKNKAIKKVEKIIANSKIN